MHNAWKETKLYDALKAEKENDDAALEELKPQLTTLNHIKYNFDVLERDYLPEEKDLRREARQERFFILIIFVIRSTAASSTAGREAA